MARVSLFANDRINIEQHGYCLCLHVRPVTIFIALVNLVGQGLVDNVVLTCLFVPALQGGSLICTLLTMFFMINNDVELDRASSHMFRDDFARVTGISILMYLLLFLVSSMLLYGVIKSKPAYILPFFGIQFIDYLFTMPQFLASIYTHPYRQYYVTKAKEQLDLMDDVAGESGTGKGGSNVTWNTVSSSHESMFVSSLLFVTVILLAKTYFLCVVYKCYRYLQAKEFILPLTMHNANINSVSLLHLFEIDDQLFSILQSLSTPMVVNSQSNIPPPNYEDAINVNEYKLPDYETAMLNVTIIDSNNNNTGNDQNGQPQASANIDGNDNQTNPTATLVKPAN